MHPRTLHFVPGGTPSGLETRQFARTTRRRRQIGSPSRSMGSALILFSVCSLSSTASYSESLSHNYLSFDMFQIFEIYYFTRKIDYFFFQSVQSSSWMPQHTRSVSPILLSKRSRLKRLLPRVERHSSKL